MIRDPGEDTFWKELGAVERKRLFALGRRAVVPARGTLCHQGVPARDVLLILDGHAKERFDARDGTEAILELLGPGELEGDLSRWGRPQRASVVALTTVAVLRIDNRRFTEFAAGDPAVTAALMRSLGRRWERAGRRLALRGAAPGPRLAFHLLELAERTGRVGPRGVRVPMPLNQAELANWVGISRESLVRCFARWRGGIIDTSRPRSLLVLDLDGLREEAGPWAEDEGDRPRRTRASPRPRPDGGPGSTPFRREMSVPSPTLGRVESFGWTILQTPIGPLMLAETAQGLVNVRFHAHDAEYHARRLADRLGLRAVRGGLREATAQLSAYFAADLTEFVFPLDWRLTSGFNERVLRLLYTRVGYGQVTGYGELARWAGDPGAARAVGAAMGANPLPVVVPCHRVVAADGGIGGFGGGPDTKRALLALEGVLPAPIF